VISLLTVVFTEFLAARRGLGQRLITSTNNFDMKTAFAIAQDPLNQ
jgi:NitT/TauT family transport system permease protein